MSDDSKIDGLPDMDTVLLQRDYLLTGLHLFLLLEPMSDSYRREVARGVQRFLQYCIVQQHSVDAAAVDLYLQNLLSERVSKTSFFHSFSVLKFFFESMEKEEAFANICNGIVPEYKIKKVRRTKRRRGTHD